MLRSRCTPPTLPPAEDLVARRGRASSGPPSCAARRRASTGDQSTPSGSPPSSPEASRSARTRARALRASPRAASLAISILLETSELAADRCRNGGTAVPARGRDGGGRRGAGGLGSVERPARAEDPSDPPQESADPVRPSPSSARGVVFALEDLVDRELPRSASRLEAARRRRSTLSTCWAASKASPRSTKGAPRRLFHGRAARAARGARLERPRRAALAGHRRARAAQPRRRARAASATASAATRPLSPDTRGARRAAAHVEHGGGEPARRHGRLLPTTMATPADRGERGGLVDRLQRPVDGASIAIFRVGFGLLGVVVVARLLAYGCVRSGSPRAAAPALLSGLRVAAAAFDRRGLLLHLAVIAISAAAIALGWHTRAALAVFFVRSPRSSCSIRPPTSTTTSGSARPRCS